ncbi:HTH-type transcriptional regulator Xre [compost metagenome]
MSIYERIERLIKSKSMTKKEFCQTLGISTGNLGDWKRGKSSPGTNKLIDIASYFDVSLDWLMTGRERPQERVLERRENYVVDEID